MESNNKKKTYNRKSSPTKKNVSTSTNGTSKTTTSVNIDISDNNSKGVKDYSASNISPSYLVPCTSCFKGDLVYASKRMQGYEERWVFGQTAYIEFIELQAMIRTDRKFFENGWLSIDDPIIVKALNVEKYFNNTLSVEDYENIFNLSPKEIESKISKMSREIRTSIGLAAIEKIENGTLDSLKIINAIENALGYKLTE